MTLASLLSPERVIDRLRSAEAWPAIVELVDRLVANGDFSMDGKTELLEALEDREAQHSTGIGEGKAIPHAFSGRVEKVVAVLGRSERGIEFGARDERPVHLVVLFVVPEGQYDLHLETLAAIAKILNNESIRGELSRAADADEMLAVIQRHTTSI